MRFNCTGRPESYYADPDFNCEVFHYCKTNGFRFTFICPPKSQFNQKQMTCDYDKPGDNLCSDNLNSVAANNTVSLDDIHSVSLKPQWLNGNENLTTANSPTKEPLTTVTPSLIASSVSSSSSSSSSPSSGSSSSFHTYLKQTNYNSMDNGWIGSNGFSSSSSSSEIINCRIPSSSSTPFNSLFNFSSSSSSSEDDELEI